MRITLTTLHKMVQEGNKITQLTCYDASFASLLESAGVETLLIVNSDRLNFLESQDDVALLMERITAMRGPREFFNLGA